MEKYLNELKKLSRKAVNAGEFPVACIIVRGNKIIAKAFNLKERKKNPMLHAEIVAINIACKKLKDWRLNDCVMYVTLEPCEMCKRIIEESRIEKVVYIVESKVCKKTMTKYEKYDKEDEYFTKLLTSFFKTNK